MYQLCYVCVCVKCNKGHLELLIKLRPGKDRLMDRSTREDFNLNVTNHIYIPAAQAACVKLDAS